MSAQTRRPPSVWIAQFVLLLVGIPFSLILALAFFRELAFVAGGTFSAAQWIWYFISVIFRLAMVVLFFFSFWGLAKRRSYGRWLSVACISLVTLFSIYGQIFRPKGQFEYAEYKSSAEWMGGMFAAVIIYGLLAFLLYRLAFGENVADFFLAEEDGHTPVEPPPPNAYFAEADSE